MVLREPYHRLNWCKNVSKKFVSIDGVCCFHRVGMFSNLEIGTTV